MMSKNFEGSYVSVLKKETRGFIFCVLAAACIALFPLQSPAQTASGTIIGSVSDQSGAAVPGVKITATNTGTNISRSVVSDASGTYAVPLLIPGIYSVQAAKEGFKAAVTPGVIVQVAQSTHVDFKLTIGAVTQTVSVAAMTPLIQTTNSTIGQVINTRSIDDLPLNGRDFLTLAVLSPMAVTQYGNTGRITQTGGYAGKDQPVIAGNRQDATTITLDGFMDMRPFDMTPVVRPTIDALQEFKVQDSNFTAESGRNPALIEIATKSGTNQLHGALWDFVRNDALDARTFFDKGIPPLRRNQFGAEVGGPIVIPHVYDGKDRSFFMFDWESSRFRVGQTVSDNFIPPAFLQGDLSTLKGSNGSFEQLYDPATTNPVTGVRQPFVNNQIPVSRLDPVAVKMLQMFSVAPNTQGFPDTIGAVVDPENNNQFTGRVDHTSGHNSIMARFSTVGDNEHDPALQPWGGQYGINKDVQVGLKWTDSIRPTLLNVARVGFTTGRTFLEQEAVDANKDLNTIVGIKNLPPGLGQFGYSVPLVGCSATIYHCPTGGQSFKMISNVMEYGDDLTDVHGSHTSTFGFTILRTRNVWASGGATGNYSFNGTYTAQQLSGFAGFVPNTGDSIADFLMGQTISAGVTSAGGNGDYFDTYYYLFAQDQWQVNPNLTLNYGVGWAYTGPYIEKYGRETFPDLSSASLAMGGRQLNSCSPLSAAQFPYNPVYNPGIGDPSLCIKDLGEGAREWADFQPRIGVAYRTRENTVLRVGGGLFFNNPQWASEMTGMSGDPPFPLFLSLNSRSLLNSQYPLDTLLPPPSQFVSQTTGRDVGPQLLGRRIPYTYEWNLSVEHSFTPNTLLEVGYAGSDSHHLQMQVPYDQARPDLPGVTTPIISRTPTPNIPGLSLLERSGNANYNAGFVKLQKRWSKGLSLLASYTWSHDLGWGGQQFFYVAGGPSTPIQNKNCLYCEYGNVDEDVRNRFVVSSMYDLPFGPGKAFLSNTSGALARLVGGWQLNLIGTLQSGLPLSCFDPRDTANVGFGSRCDYAAGHGTPPLRKNFQSTGFAFDPSYFALKPAGAEFGNTGRNILHTGPINNVDLSLFKDIRLTESMRLQFRAEFFNAFNITQFGTPDTTIIDPTFGKYIVPSSTGGGGLSPSVNPTPSTQAAREIQLGLKLYF